MISEEVKPCPFCGCTDLRRDEELSVEKKRADRLDAVLSSICLSLSANESDPDSAIRSVREDIEAFRCAEGPIPTLANAEKARADRLQTLMAAIKTFAFDTKNGNRIVPIREAFDAYEEGHPIPGQADASLLASANRMIGERCDRLVMLVHTAFDEGHMEGNDAGCPIGKAWANSNTRKGLYVIMDGTPVNDYGRTPSQNKSEMDGDLSLPRELR